MSVFDDTAAERRATIDQLSDQIVLGAARLAEHITEHPGEVLLTAALAQGLQTQLRLLKHLRRSHLVEVSG